MLVFASGVSLFVALESLSCEEPTGCSSQSLCFHCVLFNYVTLVFEFEPYMTE